MTPVAKKKDAPAREPSLETYELVEWAITEIRQLDELARSMVPGYESLDSGDMIKLQGLRALALFLRQQEADPA